MLKSLLFASLCVGTLALTACSTTPPNCVIQSPTSPEVANTAPATNDATTTTATTTVASDSATAAAPAPAAAPAAAPAPVPANAASSAPEESAAQKAAEDPQALMVQSISYD